MILDSANKLPAALALLLTLPFSGSVISDVTSWDGKYNAAFEFRMSAQTVCPKRLPIDIELVVKNGIAKGYIFNNGGGNGHEFCKLYHNGAITGTVKSDGKVSLQIKQNDSHSRQYSSFKIGGNIEGRNWVYSRSSQYHPTHTFEFTRVTEKKEIAQQVAAVIEIAVTTAPAKLTTAATSAATSAATTATSAATTATTATSAATTASAATTETDNAEGLLTQNNDISSVKTVSDAQKYINKIQASINMYITINNVIADKKQGSDEHKKYREVIQNEIQRLLKKKEQLQALLSNRFSTPIKPSNSNLGVSAFRSAETFPKIPFYIPGTNEIGETLIIPRVTDQGYLQYQFDFLDPTSEYGKVRESIAINHQDIDSIIFALEKIDDWTDIAHENNVNRRISKTVVCIPKGLCVNKKLGVTSTEIIFQIYEDGSTSGRIQRNKGLFSSGYNLSVESTVLLSAYLVYMEQVGAQEFRTGSMNDAQIENLFQ